MKRKVIARILPVFMACAMVPGPVFAQESTETEVITEAAAEAGAEEQSREITATQNEASTEGQSDAAEEQGSEAAEDQTEEAFDVTLEELKEMFALNAETEGLSSDELYEKGQQYENGDGEVQWYAMAQLYYQAAEEAGSTDAAAALENLQTHKEEVLSNSPEGQGEIFEFFRTGTTASQAGNYEQAYAVYYDDAFFFEDPLLRGIGSLGDLLRDGTGVEQDMDLAMTIYEFNAKVLGKGNGYTSLGLLYKAEDGTYPGITHSDDKAVEYFLKSYQDESLQETDFKGPRYAADYFDSGYEHDDGTHVEPDYVKAEEGYLLASVGNGRTFDGTACYKLGTYYEEGREGVAQDDEKALEYYLKAVSDENVHGTMLGIPQTYLALGRFYEEGIGTEADQGTAISYYEKAAEAAQENLDLENAAGNAAAQEVLDGATEALERLAGEVTSDSVQLEKDTETNGASQEEATEDAAEEVQ